MNDENKIILPEEMKEKGWAKSIQDENGNVDMAKVFSKLDGQESLLGKRHLPGKDSTDEEWQKFAEQMVQGYQDTDYDSVLDGLETKAEMVAALKKEGLTPKQAKTIADLYKSEKEKTVEKKYNTETFQAEIRKELNEEQYNKAVAMLKKTGMWERIESSANQAAIDTIVSLGKVAGDYDIQDKPGHVGGDSQQTQGNGKGANNQEYYNRFYELMEQGKSHEEALKQVRAEFSVTY